ncbi:MAG: response regulator [Leptolyngbyaceae cyanobacterium bins.59]|nr:response regulator [Leptolyngbyaceae cyanobacterium bins.59]
MHYIQNPSFEEKSGGELPKAPFLKLENQVPENSLALDAVTSDSLAVQNQNLAMDLRIEKFFNHLYQQIHKILFSQIGVLQASEENRSSGESVEATLLQTIATQLQDVLGNGGVAIALPQERSEAFPFLESNGLSPLEFICRIHTVAPVPNSQAQSVPYLRLPTGRSLQFTPGEMLPGTDLEALKQLSVPGQTEKMQLVWELANSERVMGWLIALPPFSGVPSPAFQEGQPLHRRLIERVVEQTAIALHQVRQVSARCPHCQKLEQQNQELMRTNRLKSEFLANTSHEIRTPLSSILGFAHLLQEQGYTPDNLRHQEYLHIIRSSGQHLLDLINDILDLSKIEADQLEIQWEQVKIPELCRNVIALVKEKAHAKQLTLRMDIQPDMTPLVADSLRLKQMLFNLLANALKFTNLGSVGLQVRQVNLMFRFTVWDTGVGLSQEQQRQLFRPYGQIRNTQNVQEGTGLGLALTRKLAELHHGWIEVKSEPGKGSEFTIVLPQSPNLSQPFPSLERRPSNTSENFSSPGNQTAYPCPSPRDAHSLLAKNSFISQSNLPLAVPSSPLSPANRHILLVEDHPLNGSLLLAYLHQLGCEVTWVREGQEMWQVLEVLTPTLILMDIQLPQVDGLTLIRQLRDFDSYRSIPIVIQTAMAMAGDRELCLQAGASAYLTKPIQFEALRRAILTHTRL